ncbi:MAG: CHASE3 domain-containing protein [Polaromonas sp.]|nr:CHASE3 domain-containing protein [Polaromonas sp.]
MKQLSIPKMVISLPLAILGAAILITINEASFHASTQATQRIEHAELARQSVGQLMHTMLDAETGTRGFLLTGDEKYLQPYDSAVAELGKELAQLRQLLANQPEDLAEFELLAHYISKRQSENDLSVRMRKIGNDDAWKFMLTTDVGKQHMDAVRRYSQKLMDSSLSKMEAAHLQVNHSLLLSRIGIAAISLAGLLAFYMYLLQTEALLVAGTREKLALQNERDRLEELVRDRTAKLAKLATYLQEVREDERGHLARELHDELGALLTAAKLDVARIRSRLGNNLPEVNERLEHLISTLNSGIALKRRIVEDLRPSSLSHLGLVASLEILTREFAEQSGIEIKTALASVELGGSAQLTVYRLVQESLTNMSKYANATHADITLHNNDDHVIIEVSDNGQGFDSAKVAATSHGLAGMRHRVEAAGGHLVIESSPGKGTHIRAKLPKTR